MLVYQEDYHELRNKISFYKSKALDDTLISFPSCHSQSSSS